MMYKQRSLSASHQCTRRDFQQAANFINLHKYELKNLQSERNNRKSQSPRKVNHMCDSPYCSSTGPTLFTIQKLEAEWKEFKENIYDQEKMSARGDITLRNRIYKNSTIENKSKMHTKRDSYDENDTDDAPLIIQKVKAFNTARLPIKHCIPVTKISLQNKVSNRRVSENNEAKLYQAIAMAKEKEHKLEDITNNDYYLTKVRSRFTKKAMPTSEV